MSLAPSCTEILFDIGAGGEVAGVCAPGNAPPQAAGLPVVASWDGLDVEKVLALKPAACFTVEGMQRPEALESLRRLGVPAVVYPMRSLADLWDCYRDMGNRTGHDRLADEKARGYAARIEAIPAMHRGAPLPAIVVVGLDPIVAAGRGSFLDGVLTAAGMRNALAGRSEPYPALSLEDIVRARPSAIVFPEGEIPEASEERLLASLRGFLSAPVAAIRVPADSLVRPGPRTADAVEAIARARAGSEERSR